MIEICKDVDDVIKKTAKVVISSAVEAVQKRGRFVIALSGGHSPQPVYKLLASESYRNQIQWENTFVFWSDERYVPLNDERSNAKSALEILLKNVTIPTDQIFPIFKDGLTPEEAAERYQKIIFDLFKTDPLRMDLTLLGCGKDSHTASLFPGRMTMLNNDDVVQVVQHDDVTRVTMTPQLINQSRHILFIVYGKEKANAVKNVLTGKEDYQKYPAQAILPKDGKMLWLLDREAASALPEI